MAPSQPITFAVGCMAGCVGSLVLIDMHERMRDARIVDLSLSTMRGILDIFRVRRPESAQPRMRPPSDPASGSSRGIIRAMEGLFEGQNGGASIFGSMPDAFAGAPGSASTPQSARTDGEENADTGPHTEPDFEGDIRTRSASAGAL